MQVKRGLTALLGVVLTSLLTTAGHTNPASQCYKMTNSHYYKSGMGDGISWNPIGKCIVELDRSGYPKSIQILKTGKMVSTTADTPVQVLKPYQNPTGKWVQGIWESDAKRSAIFAVVLIPKAAEAQDFKHCSWNKKPTACRVTRNNNGFEIYYPNGGAILRVEYAGMGKVWLINDGVKEPGIIKGNTIKRLTDGIELTF